MSSYKKWNDENILPELINSTKRNRPSPYLFCRLAVVMVIVFLSYFAMWMQLYALNEWMQQTIKLSTFPNSTVDTNFSACGYVNQSTPVYHKYQRVQQVSAQWQMYQTIATKAVAFFTTYLFAAYTDVFGRRFLFILSTFSIVLNLTMTTLIIYFNMDLIYIVYDNIIYALTGTSYGLLSAMYSYVADVTTAGKERSIGIVMIDVVTSVAGTTSGIAVGYFIENTGFVYPMLAATCMQVLAFLISIFALSESLAKEDRIKSPPLLKSLRRPFMFYTSSEFKGYRGMFIMLILAFIFADMTAVHRQAIETLYQLGMPFCWSPSMIGIFATIRSVGQNVIGLAFLKSFQRCLSGVTIAMISLASSTASYVLEALAVNDVMLYLVAAPSILNNLPCSLIRSTMSEMTSSNQQGALFASMLLIQTGCSFVTGIADNSIYAASLTFYNGFIFLVLAGYCVLAFGLLSVFTILKKNNNDKTSREQSQ